MLKGIDISKYQKNLNKDYILSQDFVIIKASEGKTYKDPMLDSFYDLIHGANDGKPDSNKLYGFYHYARPENNDPIDEAKNFLKLVGHHAGEAMYCLDWEGTAHSYPAEWAREWLDYVKSETGVKPLIYLSGSYTSKYKIVSDGDYGLWVAQWGVSKPKTGTWPFWAMWQYKVDRDINCDQDYFNGTFEQFKKYCRCE